MERCSHQRLFFYVAHYPTETLETVSISRRKIQGRQSAVKRTPMRDVVPGWQPLPRPCVMAVGTLHNEPFASFQGDHWWNLLILDIVVRVFNWSIFAYSTMRETRYGHYVRHPDTRIMADLAYRPIYSNLHRSICIPHNADSHWSQFG